MVTEVIEQTAEFIVSRALNPRQEELFRVAVDAWRDKLRREPPEYLPFVHIPVLVHRAAGGDEALGKRVACACAALFLGLDIFDDVADRDLPEVWRSYPEHEVSLAGATLIWSLPQLMIAELPLPPERKGAMLAVAARELLNMAAGQQVDLALTGSESAAPDQVIASVQGKSGAELALFGYLAASAAGVGEEAAGHFAEFGRAFGSAGQIASDLYDIFGAPESKDLKSGTRTLPITYFLAKATPEAKELLVNYDPDALEPLRQAMLASGAVRKTGLVIEMLRRKALKELEQTGGDEGALEKLREMCATFGPRT